MLNRNISISKELVGVVEIPPFLADRSRYQANPAKEIWLIPALRVTPPHSSDRDLYFVSRLGVITIEKWRSNFQDFSRLTICPNEAAAYIPAGWSYVIANTNTSQVAELEVYQFAKKT